MDDLVEKRVFAARGGATELLVAASAGLVVVSLSGERIGRFGLARACSPADVAVGTRHAAGTQLAVATAEDVLLAPTPTVDALQPSGFGEAVAVTMADHRVVAGGPDGRLGLHDGDGWTTVGGLPAPPTDLAGPLIGTAEGVFRLVDDSLRPAGLSAVSGIALAGGTPLAATAGGLYELGNGWLDVLDGAFDLVAGAPDARAHAATADTVFERAEGTWSAVDLPSSPVAAVAYGPRTYLLDTTGDLFVRTDEGWARTPLGLDGVAAAAVC